MRSFTLIFLFLSVTFLLSGQTRFGFRVGGQLSTLKIHGACIFGCEIVNQNRNLLPGFQLGLTANHKLGPGLSLDTDVIYNRRGYGIAAYQEMYATINYLSFPIILNVRFRESPIDFLAGLEPGVLLTASNYLEGEGTDASGQWSVLDVGANLGVGYRLSEAFRLKFSYYLGIPSVLAGIDQSKQEPERQGGSAALRMRAFQCSVSYYIIGG